MTTEDEAIDEEAGAIQAWKDNVWDKRTEVAGDQVKFNWHLVAIGFFMGKGYAYEDAGRLVGEVSDLGFI